MKTIEFHKQKKGGVHKSGLKINKGLNTQDIGFTV